MKSPSLSDRASMQLAVDKAHIEGMLSDALRIELRLVQPDECAYHLTIADAQLFTCHVLPLAYSRCDLHSAVVRHCTAKITAAVRC